MIYIVEDDTDIREMEKYALTSSGFEVMACASGADFFEKMWDDVPELILLDIMLPGEDGLEILSRVRGTERIAHVPVIMVTAKTSEIDKVRGLDQGADDYITKPFNILEVKARIKAILRRNQKNQARVKEETRLITAGAMKLDTEGRRVFLGDREVNLTAKEFDILELLISNPDKVFSRERLLSMVWGTKAQEAGDVRTVDVHVRRLREKIEPLPSNPRYVHTKWGVGYYFRAAE